MMAKIEEVTVEVRAAVTVPDETAEKCLRLLELWQDGNPDRRIYGDRDDEGVIRYYIGPPPGDHALHRTRDVSARRRSMEE